MIYERRTQKLLAWPVFLRRAARHLAWGIAAIAVAVGIGTAGYHAIAGLAWLDAFLNASMILGGMGPVDHIDGSGGKVFASFYALFSGLFFIGVMSLVIAPWVHRMMHVLHAEEEK
jgi:hypothetical protein